MFDRGYQGSQRYIFHVQKHETDEHTNVSVTSADYTLRLDRIDQVFHELTQLPLDLLLVDKSSSQCRQFTRVRGEAKIHSSDFFSLRRSQEGRFTFVGNKTTPHMNLSFADFPPTINEDYRVLMTDYTSYAAIWSCKRILFSNRQSAQIMSRQPTLNATVIQELKRFYRLLGIDDGNFLKIDHSRCGLERPERRSTNGSNG